jgi:hypothetical protein
MAERHFAHYGGAAAYCLGRPQLLEEMARCAPLLQALEAAEA